MKEQNDLDVRIREPYFAPAYECLKFETSGLAQMSGGDVPEVNPGYEDEYEEPDLCPPITPNLFRDRL